MAKGGKAFFTARFTGMEEVHRKLIALGVEVARPALTEAVDSGAAVVQQFAQAYVPRETWALAGAIARKTRKANNSALASSSVGIDKNVRLNGRRPVRYAHLVEFGHYARDGSRVSAQPFIRPAVQAGANGARRAMVNVMERAIRESVK